MRFNTVVPTLLALVSLVSARLDILSPQLRTVWKFGTDQQITWKVTENSQYSQYSLYLLCEDYTTMSVIQSVAADLFETFYTFKVPTVLKKCKGYHIKLVATDVCGVADIFFSNTFFITSSGKAELSGTCDDGSKKDDSVLISTPTQENEPDKKPEEKVPEDHTPTKDSSGDEEPSDSKEPVQPTSSDEIQTPVGPGESGGSDSASTQPSTDKQSSTPEKKPSDIDNSGSMVTFKLFGAFFAAIVALFFY